MELPVEILLKIFSFVDGRDLLQLVVEDSTKDGNLAFLPGEDSIWQMQLNKLFPNFSNKFQLSYSGLKPQFPERKFTNTHFEQFLFLVTYSQDIISDRLPSGERVFIDKNSFQAEIPGDCHRLILRGEGKDLVLTGTFKVELFSSGSGTPIHKILILGQISSTRLKFECKIREGKIIWFAFLPTGLYLVKEIESERFRLWKNCRLFRHQVYKIIEELFCPDDVPQFETNLLEECSQAFTSIYQNIIEKIKSVVDKQIYQ